MMVFHRFGAFGIPSKKRILVMNVLRWAPKGLVTWLSERDQRPGMVNLRKNREYAHEVAAKLIEEKRRELKDGTSRRDLLSLLGLSCAALTRPDTRCNIQLFSQGKFFPAARMATER